MRTKARAGEPSSSYRAEGRERLAGERRGIGMKDNICVGNIHVAVVRQCDLLV